MLINTMIPITSPAIAPCDIPLLSLEVGTPSPDEDMMAGIAELLDVDGIDVEYSEPVEDWYGTEDTDELDDPDTAVDEDDDMDAADDSAGTGELLKSEWWEDEDTEEEMLEVDDGPIGMSEVGDSAELLVDIDEEDDTTDVELVVDDDSDDESDEEDDDTTPVDELDELDTVGWIGMGWDGM